MTFRHLFALLLVITLGACGSARQQVRGWHFVPGTFVPGLSPDGNSVFLDTDNGLILVDTGRHAAHRDRLLAYARERGLPIVAIMNTHWHLDHSTGNADFRAAFPQAPVYATLAVEGAVAGPLARSRDQVQGRLDRGEVPPERRAQAERFLSVMRNPASLRPTRPVSRSEQVRIDGRNLELNVAPFSATEADLWIRDAAAGLVIAGDLVVSVVPFLDTACPEGWRRTLDRLAATPFTTLVPGHGEPMNRGQFLAWRAAFNGLLDCAASTRSRDDCAEGWTRTAAAFIPEGDRQAAREIAADYIDTRLRSAPEERARYCRPAT